jgi:hypothetical protein
MTAPKGSSGNQANSLCFNQSVVTDRHPRRTNEPVLSTGSFYFAYGAPAAPVPGAATSNSLLISVLLKIRYFNCLPNTKK